MSGKGRKGGGKEECGGGTKSKGVARVFNFFRSNIYTMNIQPTIRIAKKPFPSRKNSRVHSRRQKREKIITQKRVEAQARIEHDRVVRENAIRTIAENGTYKAELFFLDSIAALSVVPDSIMQTLFSYAQLVENIFILSNPTASRSTNKQIPNTFQEFKTKWIHNQDGFKEKFINRIGFGNPGFADASVTARNYYLLCISNKTDNELVSGALLIDKVRSDVFIADVFGVAANPKYIGSGGGSALILSILYTPFVFGTEDSRKKHFIQLEVAKDSYPFTEFIDRFIFYARNGFTTAKGSMQSIVENDVYSIDLSKERFNSKYILGAGNYDEVVGSAGLKIGLESWKSGLKASTPTSDVYFRTDAIASYDITKILTDLKSAMEKIKPSAQLSNALSIPLPTSLGFISHSGYVPTRDKKGIATFKVPDNLEIIIMNTPGYTTYSNIFSSNWAAVAKYFRYIPIDYLKKLFPPFKSTNINETQVVPLTSKAEFIHATSGGIMYNITGETISSSIQIHCYNSGDFCPELGFGVRLGPGSDDHASLLFGLYDMSSETEPDYKKLYMTRDFNKLNSNENQLFDERNPFMPYANDKWPDSRYRIWPLVQDNLNPSHMVYDITISFGQLIQKIGELITHSRISSGKKRICIFSCGDIDSETNEKIKSLNALRKNQIYSVDQANYRKIIDRTGEAIFDIYNYGSYLGPRSPASAAAATAAATAAAPLALVKSPRRSTRKSTKRSKRSIKSSKRRSTKRSIKSSKTSI
jgi:hypothetical protein